MCVGFSRKRCRKCLSSLCDSVSDLAKPASRRSSREQCTASSTPKCRRCMERGTGRKSTPWTLLRKSWDNAWIKYPRPAGLQTNARLSCTTPAKCRGGKFLSSCDDALREAGRERVREIVCVYVCMCACLCLSVRECVIMCVCVCVAGLWVVVFECECWCVVVRRKCLVCLIAV